MTTGVYRIRTEKRGYIRRVNAIIKMLLESGHYFTATTKQTKNYGTCIVISFTSVRSGDETC